MMRRFVESVCASGVRRFRGAVLAGIAGCLALAGLSSEASAQEIQLTGPLAGAPAVRKLRQHRKGRLEISPMAAFTLLDQYERSIFLGGHIGYFPTDWIGFGLWGGAGLHSVTALTTELQDTAINARNCAAAPSTPACQLTQTNLTRPGGTVTLSNGQQVQQTGSMEHDQLGQLDWVLSPQLTVVPFRGKLALFSLIFVDTDVNLFAGPAFIGLQERADCGAGTSTPCASAFGLTSRMAIAPSFGLGVNMYPSDFIGFGFEFRAMPFAWNTSGFDNHGGGPNGAFPDGSVNSADRELHLNPMITLHVSFHLPVSIKTTD